MDTGTTTMTGHHTFSISIFEGQVTNLSSDVIVNSTNQDLNLAYSSGVSSSILKAAGVSLQEECKEKYPHGIKPGQVARTKGHNIPCAEIFHVALIGEFNADSIQMLRRITMECLGNASESDYSSIAFPALGTGLLGYPPHKVASIMLDVICQFQKTKNSLREVVIVINNEKVLKSFHRELHGRLQSTINELSFTLATLMPEKSADSIENGSSNLVPKPRERLKKKRKLLERRKKEKQSCPESQHVNSEKDSVTIVISSLTLSEDSRLLANPAVRKLFVSYCFLGLPPQETEMPFSIVKSHKPRQINFSKSISVSAEEHFERRQCLAAMLMSRDPNRGRIRFVLVSEPDIDEEADCEDVGVSYISVPDILSNKMNVKDESIDILDIHDESKKLGEMKVSVECLAVLEDIKECLAVLEDIKVWVAINILSLRLETDSSFMSSMSIVIGLVTTAGAVRMPNGFPTIDIGHQEVETMSLTKRTKVPSTWVAQEMDETVKLVPLLTTSDEYQKVTTGFWKTLTSRTAFVILRVSRIQNPLLYKQYQIKKTQMEMDNGGDGVNEKLLWHGTSPDSVPSINHYGFNRSYCGKNMTLYGKGVYFAVNSETSTLDAYSPPDPSSQERYVYQCKVLAGYSTVGKEKLTVLPIRSHYITYDSATDTVHKPSLYVIFHDTQAYPEYLITFKTAEYS